jgi:ribosomal protein S18 acetylase RimI-like enzyme
VKAIRYMDDMSAISAAQLADGFWEGWPERPSTQTHLAALRSSHFAVVAVDEQTNQVVGFISAIADDVMAAFIPTLEVLPAYRRQGIATELIRRVLDHYSDYHSVDLVCDADLVPFYERLGATQLPGMAWRHRSAVSKANERFRRHA